MVNWSIKYYFTNLGKRILWEINLKYKVLFFIKGDESFWKEKKVIDYFVDDIVA